MKNGVTVTGMVLSSMPIGEYDRRISLLTSELGRISVFAKGARKPNGAFVACTQTFSFGEFTVFPGKAYTLIGADIKNYFPEFRTDFEKMSKGMFFCEVASRFAQEGQEESDCLKLLYVTLLNLAYDRFDPLLLKSVFELRLLRDEGLGAECFECVGCRKHYEDGDAWFGAGEGGLLCEDCRTADSMAVHRGTVLALQHISSCKIEKLYSFSLEPERAEELKNIAAQYWKRHVDFTFKSEEMYSF